LSRSVPRLVVAGVLGLPLGVAVCGCGGGNRVTLTTAVTATLPTRTTPTLSTPTEETTTEAESTTETGTTRPETTTSETIPETTTEAAPAPPQTVIRTLPEANQVHEFRTAITRVNGALRRPPRAAA
jgi:hypothetical protein